MCFWGLPCYTDQCWVSRHLVPFESLAASSFVEPGSTAGHQPHGFPRASFVKKIVLPRSFLPWGTQHWEQHNGVVPIGHFASWTKVQMWRQQECHANLIAVQVTGKCKRIPVSPVIFLGPSTTFRWKLLWYFWRMSRCMTQVYTLMSLNQPWCSYGMILFDLKVSLQHQSKQ